MSTEKKVKADKRIDEKKKGILEERVFLWVLLAFAVLEAVLVAYLLFTYMPIRLLPPTGDGTAQSTPPAQTVPTPSDDPYVFENGVVPKRPTENAGTAVAGDELYSQFMFMMNGDGSRVLAGKQADARLSPASMTKVMTLIVACENLKTEDLDRKVTLTQEIWDYVRTGHHTECEIYGHDVGDEIKIRDLLYGIALESASDCVMMVVLEICESEEAFAELMNAKAEQLGLVNTHFDNAVGYESENNYTTAREMAMILSYALQSDMITQILSCPTYVSRGWYYKDGMYEEFRFTYYNTLHTQRKEAYKEYAKEDFKIAGATLQGGKTGYWDSSFLVCFGTKQGSGEKYVLVLGDASAESVRKSCYYTMADVKYCFETYLP
ncbi:MAG: D-alanyl-D-alanine carboxypeptidase [Clostridia bacterium]|nr:D-alanyl-D-alanine carboxypeptidase [Clostridia bacterium]